MAIERKLLILATAALAGIGLLMVYSSSITSRPSFTDEKFLIRHFVFMTVGIAVAGAASCVSPDLWRRTAFPLYFLSILLLIAVLIPGVGSQINGAHRWFRLGALSVQPSELAKLAQLLFLARAAELKGEAIRRFWSGWLLLLLPCILVGCLVLLEPDFGTAIFLTAVALLLVFLAGIPTWHLLVSVGIAAPMVVLLVLAQPYRVKRVLEFVRGWSDPLAAPYQVQQSLVAFGSGGFAGTGLGRGWQKLGFLPEANTDFVFAVIGEELGLAGTLTMLGLWALFLVCGVRLVRKTGNDVFGRLASFGLIAQLVLQAAMNIGVVTASLPPKGISLPFVSYGGSNLVISLVSVGVVLGLTRKERRGSSTRDEGSSSDESDTQSERRSVLGQLDRAA